jgi:hypothetical protein
VYCKLDAYLVSRPATDENEIWDNEIEIKKLVLKHEISKARLDTPGYWIDEAVAAHNELRYKHSSPAISRSDEVKKALFKISTVKTDSA